MGFEIGKKYPMRNGRTIEFCGTNETHNLDLLTFVDGMNNHFFYFKDGRRYSIAADLSLYDIISDTPIGEEPEEVVVSVVGTPFPYGRPVEPRRQFDVSKLIERYEEKTALFHSLLNPDATVQFEQNELAFQLEVLEAWNAGTIEGLLEGWVSND